jgi:hypothetical protein
MPTVAELGQRVKLKYPGTYDDLPDDDLGRRVKAKYPGAYDDFTEVQVAPAGDPGMLGRVRNLLAGTARNIDELARATVDVSPGSPRSFLGRVLAQDKPLIPAAEALLPPQPGDNPFVNFTRGAVEAAEGMTRPSSLALLGGLGAAGAVGRAAATPIGRIGSRVLDVGIDAFFATQAGKGLLESAPRIKAAYETKNYPALFTELGQDTVQAIFGTYFGVRGGRKGMQLQREARWGWREAQRRRAGEPVVVPERLQIAPPPSLFPLRALPKRQSSPRLRRRRLPSARRRAPRCGPARRSWAWPTNPSGAFSGVSAVRIQPRGSPVPRPARSWTNWRKCSRRLRNRHRLAANGSTARPSSHVRATG